MANPPPSSQRITKTGRLRLASQRNRIMMSSAIKRRLIVSPPRQRIIEFDEYDYEQQAEKLYEKACALSSFLENINSEHDDECNDDDKQDIDEYNDDETTTELSECTGNYYYESNIKCDASTSKEKKTKSISSQRISRTSSGIRNRAYLVSNEPGLTNKIIKQLNIKLVNIQQESNKLVNKCSKYKRKMNKYKEQRDKLREEKMLYQFINE